jgi:hypothetical protein
MRALKALVIFMAIAIVVGVSVLATLMLQRAQNLSAPAPVAGVAAPSAPGAELRKLVLPEGARVVETRLDGARVTLRASLAGGGEALFVFDAATGRPMARYDISTEGGR